LEIISFIWNYGHPAVKGGTAVAIRKGVPHSYVDLPSLTSIEATAVCMTIGNKEILLATVYRSPVKDWCDRDIKTVLAGDLNAIHSVWNSQIPNRSSRTLLKLQDNSKFQITAPRYPTH
jgi:hypothetical protein